MSMPVTHTHEEAAAAAAEKWLDQLDPATVEPRDASRVRAIIAAVEAETAAADALRKAVADARAAGDSWTVIGAALGTSRQAAHERYRSVDDR